MTGRCQELPDGIGRRKYIDCYAHGKSLLKIMLHNCSQLGRQKWQSRSCLLPAYIYIYFPRSVQCHKNRVPRCWWAFPSLGIDDLGDLYTLVSSNMASWEISDNKWRFLAGKIFYKWRIFRQAMMVSSPSYCRWVRLKLGEQSIFSRTRVMVGSGECPQMTCHLISVCELRYIDEHPARFAHQQCFCDLSESHPLWEWTCKQTSM